jgi:catechol 2,3-dioxygenase-like lactoylglutathione lyase family enzyme
VRDLARSTDFYLALGWPLSEASVAGEVSFFKTQGGILALWGHDALAADAGVAGAKGAAGEAPPAYRGTALAVNVDSPAAVDDLLRRAEAAGARITRRAEKTDWGGYNGYFADPDGHLWEAAYNPGWPIGPDGRPQLP